MAAAGCSPPSDMASIRAKQGLQRRAGRNVTEARTPAIRQSVKKGKADQQWSDAPVIRSSPASHSRSEASSRRLIVKAVVSIMALGYLKSVTILKIGRYMATTIPPITTPRKTIIRGSMRAVRAPTAVSTSSS